MTRLGRLGLATALVGAGLAAGCAGDPEPAGAPPAAVAVPAGAPGPGASAFEPLPLAFGEAVERELAGGGCHRALVVLARGDLLDLSLDQDGIDVVTTVVAPDAAPALEIDGPIGAFGIEAGAFLAEQAGEHRIEVCALSPEAPSGRYTMEAAAPRRPSESDRARALGHVRYFEARRLESAGSLDEATAAFEQARAHFASGDDPRGEAWALYKLGVLAEGRGRPDQAEAKFRQSALRHGELGERRREATVLTFLGRSLSRQGQVRAALEVYEQAARIAEEVGASSVLWVALRNAAANHDQLGHTLEALRKYHRLLEAQAGAGAESDRWRTLSWKGKLYLRAGDDGNALRRFGEALRLARKLGDPPRTADSLEDLGRVHVERGANALALRYFEDALSRLREPPREQGGDGAGEATAARIASLLNNVGRVHLNRGDLGAAEKALEEALHLVGSGAFPDQEGAIRANLAKLRAVEGRPSEALEQCRSALDRFRLGGRAEMLASGLRCVAENEADRGNLSAAREAAEQALELVETLRNRSLIPGLRASLFAAKREYWELYVEILMRLDAAEPGRGWAARAFEAAERSRARTLLDALAEGELDLSPELSHRLLDREEALGAERARLEAELLALDSRAGHGADAASLRRRLQEIESEHAIVKAEISARHPELAALRFPRPLDVEGIRRKLLADAQTQVLSYFLGPERSYAWVLGRDSFAAAVLPGRREIERAALRSARLFAESSERHKRVPAELAAGEVSRLILDPVATHLVAPRIALVKDGALAAVPFAALSPQALETDPGPPLLDRFELVEIPSASVLVALRELRARREPPAGTVAVLGDPVFEAADERLSGSIGRADRLRHDNVSDPATRASTLADVRRLKASGDEARAIAALAPPGKSLLALGFDASRETVFSGRLGEFRIVHFATHSLVHPALAGIVLSRFDEAGRAVDGLLRPHEIYRLRLRADLVVLSACRTGIGEPVWGEGPMSLSRGFLHAGTSSVLVSLWDVGDRATSELMVRLYERLLLEGLDPAVALRETQRALRRRPGAPAPSDWAGFVVQGDWQ